MSLIKCDYPQCEKSYTCKSDMQRHVLSFHKNERYSCDYQGCKKSYSEKVDLKNHIGSYHRNVRYTCDGCQTKYKNKRTLDLHLKKQQCKKSSNKKQNEQISVVEAHLADIDSQIETVATLISGISSVNCHDCTLNK